MEWVDAAELGLTIINPDLIYSENDDVISVSSVNQLVISFLYFVYLVTENCVISNGEGKIIEIL